MAGSVQASDPLQDLRWNNRLLLVFAPAADDPRVRATRERLQASDCGVRDRDIVIGWFPAVGEARVDGRAMSTAEADRVRRRYQVETETFAVMLGNAAIFHREMRDDFR